MDENRPIGDIRVSDVLKEVEKAVVPATVSDDAPLNEAVKAIVENRETRKVYALDKDGKLVGTITLEVLLRHLGYKLGVRPPGMTSFLRMLAEISDDRVSQVMAKPVRVSQDELLLNATKLMVDQHLNDLPVVDGGNRLVAELSGIEILKLSVRRGE